MNHLVLLGDSIFDNASYVRQGSAVIDHLRGLLPSQWEVTLLAVDGATTTGLPSQVRSVPSSATHLFVSIGGNDALGHTEVLDSPVRSSADTWRVIAKIISGFDADYRAAITACLRKNLPLVTCTIYNGNFPDDDYQRRAAVALKVFNDSIARITREKGCGIIELRNVCTSPEHYANPIEPSEAGGRRIAEAILASLR